jgi:cobalamin synthase
MTETEKPGFDPSEHSFAAWWQDWLVAISALTAFKPEILPPPDAAAEGRARRAYPLVALLLGLFTVTIFGAGRSLRLGDLAAVTLALGLLILLTGARGEIGLAAYVEAAARGGDPAARRSALAAAPFGYAGTIVLVLSLLLRIGILDAIGEGKAAVLIAVIVGSRTALALAPVLRSREERAAEGATLGNEWLWLAAALGVAFLLLFLGPWGGLVGSLAALFAMWVAVGLARRQYEAFSAPVYAMIQQATEIALLVAAAAAA